METNVDRWIKEAENNNLQFVEYRNGINNVYLLPCGHEQKLSPEDVVGQLFECQVCASKK